MHAKQKVCPHSVLEGVREDVAAYRTRVAVVERRLRGIDIIAVAAMASTAREPLRATRGRRCDLVRGLLFHRRRGQRRRHGTKGIHVSHSRPENLQGHWRTTVCEPSMKKIVDAAQVVRQKSGIFWRGRGRTRSARASKLCTFVPKLQIDDCAIGERVCFAPRRRPGARSKIWRRTSAMRGRPS